MGLEVVARLQGKAKVGRNGRARGSFNKKTEAAE